MTTAPAMRMLVDLGDLDHSRWVNQSGVSGHAYHRNYDDQTHVVGDNQMWPFVSSRRRGGRSHHVAARTCMPGADRAQIRGGTVAVSRAIDCQHRQ